MFRVPATWARQSLSILSSLSEASTSAITLGHLRLRDARRLALLAGSLPPRSVHGQAHSLDSPRRNSTNSERRQRARSSRQASGERQDKFKSRDARSHSPAPTTQPTSSSSIYPHSRASLRPHPNARAPLFASRVFVESDPRVRTLGERSDSEDKDLILLEQHLRRLVTHKTVGDVESVVEACNFLAQYWAKKQMKPTYQPYYALLEALSYRGLLDECYQVLDDMEASGFKVDIGSLNWTLKAAVVGSREEDMLKICRRINDYTDSSSATGIETESASFETPIEESVAMPAPYATRNFSSFTYTCLFQYCSDNDRAEQAMIWFSALVNSRSTSVQAFLDLLRPSGAQYLIETLLSVQEYRLAVELAEWIHMDSSGRLISPKIWTEIASACAVGNYYPGLKHGFLRGVKEGGVVADEGFLIAALRAACRAPDSDLCHELLQDFLVYSTQWVNMRIPDTTPPPVLQHPHLLPLVEALAREGKFVEAYRLMGALFYWGIPLDPHASSVLEIEASLTKAHLIKAVAAWEQVINEGKNSVEGEPEPIATLDGRASILRRVTDGKIPALAGRVEINTMNSLIIAAARLGEDEIALKVWEDRRLARMRPSLSRALSPAQEKERQRQPPEEDRISAGKEAPPRAPVEMILPTIETFNGLLDACLRSKIPSVSLAHSIFNELRTKHDWHLKPNALTYEHLIKILLINPSSSPNARLDAEALRRAFERLEECKSAGLTPTSKTYEAMIRTCLRGSDEREDPRWWRLLDEMTREAKHELPAGLEGHIAHKDRSRRFATDGREGLKVPPALRRRIEAKAEEERNARRGRGGRGGGGGGGGGERYEERGQQWGRERNDEGYGRGRRY
ncbi:hypothetical protein BCV69DRAFT_297796 [Microstroma glucosiphilum]|uniref:Pentacotripeptide-repeat region of PRORP domain-containing protein n=1 Tax=Pseudomicrostroma glucosiphilum TaxID=1684307 RepID=A0A316UBG9_9BASI|nr:hypothetical protein BCV69DRAFT_297796 [Pseudomicrostroma glucosiphilum]PWN22509.1 hypothetical protein BCV69DRAFT_297796 [Pseudomicrostroma glucosiphilum]